MRLVTYRPWYPSATREASRQQHYHPLGRLHDEMNRLFDESFGQMQSLSSEIAEFSPSVDIDQDDDHYSVTLEIPGVRREDVSVETHEDMLVISGSKNKETKSDRSENVQSARRFGRFTQTLALPDDADRDGISAEFADGVLNVTIPRDKEREKDRSRRIEVREGSSSAETSGEAKAIGSGSSASAAGDSREKTESPGNEESPGARDSSAGGSSSGAKTTDG